MKKVVRSKKKIPISPKSPKSPIQIPKSKVPPKPRARELTEKEKWTFFDFIKIQPGVIEDTSEAKVDRIKRIHMKQMDGLKFYPGVIPQMKIEMERFYYRSLLSPGDMVGVSGSTFAAEIITQLVLNTFHFSGMSAFSITNNGTPRLTELMNGTYRIKNPQMTLFLTKRVMYGDKYYEARDEFYGKNVNLLEEAEKNSIYFDENYVEENEEDKSLHIIKKTGKIKQDLLEQNLDITFEKSTFYPNCTNGMDTLKNMFFFSKNKIEEVLLKDLLVVNKYDEKKIIDIQENRKLTRREKEWYSLYFTLFSDDAKKKLKGGKWKVRYEWSLRLNFDKTQLLKRSLSLQDIAKKIEIFRDLYCVFSPDNMGYIDVYVDTSYVEIPKHRPDINDKNKDKCFVETVVKDYLHDLQICGIQDIEQVYFFKNGGGWSTQTIGTNLKEVMNIQGIVSEKIITNSVIETCCMGIEYQRSVLITELKNVISGILQCHLVLLADAMTHTGQFSNVTRNGIDKIETGPLTRAAFEETFVSLVNGPIKGEIEEIKGVSGCVAMGQLANFGTGNMFSLSLDTNKTEKSFEQKEWSFLKKGGNENIETEFDSWTNKPKVTINNIMKHGERKGMNDEKIKEIKELSRSTVEGQNDIDSIDDLINRLQKMDSNIPSEKINGMNINPENEMFDEDKLFDDFSDDECKNESKDGNEIKSKAKNKMVEEMLKKKMNSKAKKSRSRDKGVNLDPSDDSSDSDDFLSMSPKYGQKGKIMGKIIERKEISIVDDDFFTKAGLSD